NGKPFELVNWKSNTLTTRSKQLTTISAVYETAQLILHSGFFESTQMRPEDAKLDDGTDKVGSAWKVILEGLKPYRAALANPEGITAMRDDKAAHALLFKPAAQIALVRGLLTACADGRMPLQTAVARANGIDWRMDAPVWAGVIIKQSGAIDAGTE